MPFTKDQVEEAKAKSKTGEAHPFEVVELGLDFILRPPTSGEYKRFRVMAVDSDPLKRTGALEQLFRDCCLLPEAAELAPILERYPALGEDLGMECRRLAGGFKEVRAKKL
ncbi:MAG TPA: hypothetical protein VMB50_20835 [Myxococcales bacterium]|nr:hypothetical protein [Myxococcales bacterium]